MSQASPNWTDEQKEIFNQGLADGLSCELISRRIGFYEDGKPIRTRNAVISYIHRKVPQAAHNTTKRASRSSIFPSARPNRSVPTPQVFYARQLPPVVETPAESDIIAPTGGVRFIDLEPYQCKWPTEKLEGEDITRFCGGAQFKGIPGHPVFGMSCYCLKHYRESINAHYRAQFEQALRQNRARSPTR
jgi:hypothetical protein